MFKFKSASAYWQSFSEYQSFTNVDEMNAVVKRFVSVYELTSAAESVLNTIKLHAKRFVGVCWLYREEIARKAGVSLSSVNRAIKALKETGILTVHHTIHTKRGGQTHSVYVINREFTGAELAAVEPANESANESPLESEKLAEMPRQAEVSASQPQVHKNLDTNSHKTLKDKTNSIKIDNNEPDVDDVLKSVPTEFITLMKPYYDGSPDVIAARWKTACVAIKKSCVDMTNASWETIGQAWRDVVRQYKQRKIRNSSDDGLGGYFYRVLCDYLLDDYLRKVWG
ncbi:winged helix-turn-helix transcriptional regulator [Brevibacillus reuszeri]|uniref:winged helix-turn-helix transcriptional regulator n=1 Tax=Brevibacillus reuszeri TaxID=54915 RepID=UPI000CCC7681|nr:winged helix-turn-helix transcriptional regulator [Brevibacillus reuszeri]